MGKISDTSKYPVVTPTGTDILIGTDVGSSNATKNFTVASINALASAYILTNPSGGVLQLSDGVDTSTVTLSSTTGLDITSAAANTIQIDLRTPVNPTLGGTGLTAAGNKRQVLTSTGSAFVMQNKFGPVLTEVTSVTGTYTWDFDSGDTLNITLTSGVSTTLAITNMVDGDEGTLIVNGAGGGITLPNPGSKIKGSSYGSTNGRQDLLTFKYVDSKFHWIATTDLVTYTP